MKWIVLVMCLNGPTAGWVEWDTFKTETEANAYCVRLFDFNRKQGYKLKKRGYDLPTDWEGFNKNVIVKPKP